MGHPDVWNVATSIGVNVEKAKDAVIMMSNIEGLINSVYEKF